ncbi:30S ribosomal protein S9 [Phytomonospora endophytica]|uniref:Small ribosomal subunit protein uS9 n=1 Tax=Phytomonospora endophytica TaxID=714109 RepID=A0A841FEG5_9ACTN|nr:30S ribosomal protein S9 [Phytomonospora endophytica]MBB6033403.1 small subunit ribosomal protein S9 [Phytomonospora endophytica]
MTEPTTAPEATDDLTAEVPAVADVPAVPAVADVPAVPAVADVPAPYVPRMDKPVQTVGRRKKAIVRARLKPGTGKFLLNGRSLEEYFPSKVSQQIVKEPLVTIDRVETFDIFANLHGGGITGQAGALRLAIARALIEIDPEVRPELKKAGFLTRDARATERKKYGLKKARKAPQFSKR